MLILWPHQLRPEDAGSSRGHAAKQPQDQCWTLGASGAGGGQGWRPAWLRVTLWPLTGLHRPDSAAEPSSHGPIRAAVPSHGETAAHLRACGHLEPDPGPLGVHPVPPGGDPAPPPWPQCPVPVALPAAPAHPEAHRGIGPGERPWELWKDSGHSASVLPDRHSCPL